MDGFKKNLHLVVLAAGVIVGAALLGVGIMIKTGAQERLATDLASLPKTTGDAAPPTRGDLMALQAAREKFNQQMGEVDRLLRAQNGAALRADMENFTDAVTYRSREGNARLAELQRRFRALERPQPMPEVVGPRFIPALAPPEPVWTRMQRDLEAASDAPRILAMQIQLRVLEEVCTICEALQRSGGFANDGILLLDMKLDARSSEAIPPEQPWEDWPFTVALRCRPALATAIVSELASPTQLTSARPRRNFPVAIEAVQQEMAPRPYIAIAEISNEDKPEYGIPVDAATDSDVVRQAAQRIAESLAADPKARFQTGLNVGIRARALWFNRNWRALADEQPGQ